LAARRNKQWVEMRELEEAIDRVVAGPERKSRMMSEKEKTVIAYHESGHTLIAKILSGDPVHKVSIIPRGPALGYTLQLPTEDKYLTPKSEILNRLCVLLGGRCAEELIFGDVTTGAQDDLSKATEISHKMVCEFGMSDRLGPITYQKSQQEMFLGRDMGSARNYSEQTAQMIDEEVKRIVGECKEKVKKLLSDNRGKLDALAKALVEKEVLSSDEITRIIKGEPLDKAVTGFPSHNPSEEGGSAAGGATAPVPTPA
jgi:cell division protease FtsH